MNRLDIGKNRSYNKNREVSAGNKHPSAAETRTVAAIHTRLKVVKLSFTNS